MTRLRADGATTLTLVGLCSGGYASLYAAVDQPGVDQVVMLNPQVLRWHEGFLAHLEARHLSRRLRDPDLWRKAIRGGVDVRRAARIVVGRVRSRPVAPDGPTPGEIARETVAALHRRGVRTSFVFSVGDPGIEHVEAELGPRATLLDDALTEYHLLTGPDHMFTAHWARDRVTELVTALVRR